MLNRTSAPSRLSQRITGARARWAALGGSRPSRGETFAIGLGCDNYRSPSL